MTKTSKLKKSHIGKYGNLYLIKGDTYSIKLDTNEK